MTRTHSCQLRAAQPCFLAALFLGLAAARSSEGVHFQGLGDLPGGGFESTAFGISADGKVVVGEARNADGLREAFRWTAADGMLGLGILPVPNIQPGRSRANAASDDGSVIVGFSRSFDVVEAFRWTEDGGMVGIGDLDGSDFESEALAVNQDGSVIVGASVSPGSDAEAFVWTEPTGITGLGHLPNLDRISVATAVSDDGSVVLGSSVGTSSVQRVFRWTSGSGFVDLGGLPVQNSTRTSVEAVTPSGEVIVGGADINNGRVAYRWTETTGYVPLGDLRDGRSDSRALDVSADGNIVVGRGQGSFDPRHGPQKAFIWDEVNGMRDLNAVLSDDFGIDLTGWLLLEASGISADGLTFVGYGLNPNGDIEAWIATIPEPSGVALLTIGILVVAATRKRWG